VFVGARFDYNEVDNQAVLITGDASTVSPYVGAKLERLTDASTTRATVTLSGTGAAVGGAASAQQVLTGGTEVVIALTELLEAESAEDTAKECARLKGELESTQKILAGVTAKLANESFTSRAKPEVVEGARAQERDLSQKVDALTRKVEALCGTR
jgi:valyl-tRNA synthetase